VRGRQPGGPDVRSGPEERPHRWRRGHVWHPKLL